MPINFYINLEKNIQSALLVGQIISKIEYMNKRKGNNKCDGIA